MSFEVDPSALDQFADLLGKYFDDSRALLEFIGDETEMSVHGQGLIDHLVGGHQHIVEVMRTRVDYMSRVSLQSSAEMASSAEFYQREDEASAARLDEAYDAAKPYEDNKPAPEKKSFKSLDAQGELEITKKASDLEPKGDEVDKWIREKFDQFSIVAQARQLLTAICNGFDPINWVREWMYGEWKAWAHAAHAWEACAKAAGVMGESLWRSTAALESAWKGKAADSAVAYFEQFRDATFTEEFAYYGLFETYKLYTEFIYETHLILDDVLNTTLDLVIELLLVVGAVFKSPFDEGGFLIQRILGLVSSIGMIYTAVSDAVRLFETGMTAAFGLPGIPDSALPQLFGRDDGEGHGWDHPDGSV